MSDDGLDRRTFLKMLGGGALGLGALSMVPGASAFQVTSDNAFTVSNTTDTNFVVGPKGAADFKQHEAQNLVLHKVSGDPSSPRVGQIWYDTSAD